MTEEIPHASDAVVQEFITKYKRDKPEHEALAQLGKDICDGFLRSGSYLGIVTCRAKDEESLRTKLLKEHRRRPRGFKDGAEISSYIVDRSGVRIALYYPHQKEHVKRFLHDDFEVLNTVFHPSEDAPETLKTTELHHVGNSLQKETPGYEKKFRGYHATHYHVRLKGQHKTKRFDGAEDMIEIQVMTVLQSAWSEVEHNIIYKQLQGSPSMNERQMLDGLNGLVSVGETYMEHINTAFEIRVKQKENQEKPFANRYVLGSFLSSELTETLDMKLDEFTLSAVELLRRFLNLDHINLNTQAKLRNRMREFRFRSNPETFPCLNGKKPNASLVIMESLYTNHLCKQPERCKPNSPKERCGIMMSTIISLDELFPPFNCWEPELTNPAIIRGNNDHLENLKWLMHHPNPRSILVDDVTAERDDSQRLRSLWHWFETHESNVVRFVFDITRLGLIRDLRHEFPLLERIYRMLTPLHP